MIRLALATLAAAALASPVLAQTLPALPDVAPYDLPRQKLILVGDSTVATGSGWGGAFCDDHTISALACLNLGREGRSTRTYRDDGSWDIALAEIQPQAYAAVWVLIQFGHNDEPGKRSSTDPDAYAANLTRYVEEVRARGGRPILATPVTRRIFSDGKLQNSLEERAAIVRRVAAESHTPLIDLNALSADAVQAMGAEAAARLGAGPFPHSFVLPLQAGQSPVPPPQLVLRAAPVGRRSTEFDYTHMGPTGASVFAKLVVDAMITATPELAPILVP